MFGDGWDSEVAPGLFPGDFPGKSGSFSKKGVAIVDLFAYSHEFGFGP